MADARRYLKLSSPFAMKRGGELIDARIAWESWGELNAARDNAVFILTGLSPDAHAASNADNADIGWWEGIVGPGKALDSERWYIVCVNSLGSCKGSTGPASVNPENNALYRLDFPELALEDIANAAFELMRDLKIERLAALVGCSMGGMSSLAWMLAHPGSVRAHISISTAPRAQPFAIAIRSLQRESIRLDPNWNDGAYDDEHYPEVGMRLARKLGVITYRSAMEWRGRFGRIRLEADQRPDEPFGREFEIESYLEGHARRFARQFDPNAYLYLSRASDWFDAGETAGGDVDAALRAIALERALVIGVESDILFPIEQQEHIATSLREGGADVDFVALDSPQGHDAFLVDIERFGVAISDFMATLH